MSKVVMKGMSVPVAVLTETSEVIRARRDSEGRVVYEFRAPSRNDSVVVADADEYDKALKEARAQLEGLEAE